MKLPNIALQAAAANARLTAHFLGTTSILLRDEQTAILSDGFVSRPDYLSLLFGRIAPNLTRIRQTLERLAPPPTGAVSPCHSHYDHALDAAELARQTGALLVGCESTAN